MIIALPDMLADSGTFERQFLQLREELRVCRYAKVTMSDSVGVACD